MSDTEGLEGRLREIEARIAEDPHQQQWVYSGGGKYRGWCAFWGDHAPRLDEWHHGNTEYVARVKAALAALAKLQDGSPPLVLAMAIGKLSAALAVPGPAPSDDPTESRDWMGRQTHWVGTVPGPAEERATASKVRLGLRGGFEFTPSIGATSTPSDGPAEEAQ